MGRPADGIGRVLALATSTAKVRFVERVALLGVFRQRGQTIHKSANTTLRKSKL
jgi:hypothetical protein